MSRIARKPVMIPAGVKVAVNPAARTVNFEGPKGKLSMTYRPEVGVKLEGAIVEVTMDPAIVDLGSNRAFWGTTRALIATAVEGVLKGYEKKLEIVGVGYLAAVAGKVLQVRAGYANEIHVPIPEGLKVVCPDQNHVVIQGIDKQMVGQFAAEVRSIRKPEPYKGKGIRYDGEVVRRKAGKAVTK